jgi:hypothetical protein
MAKTEQLSPPAQSNVMDMAMGMGHSFLSTLSFVKIQIGILTQMKFLVSLCFVFCEIECLALHDTVWEP